MQFKTYLQSKLPFYFALSSLFILASCGSYQYVGYDNDGIYSSSQDTTVSEEPAPISNDNAYYKGYFAEKSQKYENIAKDDNVIFTDIDTYEGTYNQVTGEVEYEESYAGWGQDSDNVTINVYNNDWGWNNWGWNAGWGLGWNNWGWNNWGWNAGWGYGWNNWGWNNWGWNAGFGWCPPYYGYAGNYHNNAAFHSGRRNSYASNVGRNNSVTRGNGVTRNSDGRNTITRRNTNGYNPSNSIRTGSNTRINNSSIGSNSSNVRGTRSNTRINNSSSGTRANSNISSPSRSSSNSSSVRSSSPSRSSSSGSSGRSSGGSSRRGG